MYVQKIGETWREVVGNVLFAPNVFQTAESLSAEQRQELNVYLIEDDLRPVLTNIQRYGDPIYTIKGGGVERSYAVVNKTEQEIADDAANKINEIRLQRNQKLSESDWTQLTDSPVDKTAWATYRQALRDLPANIVDPFNPIWPTSPGV
tara:strand:- start:29350 stop:29796 length:447 start_codon:yes stop_codon:yes gene_type:complete